MDTGEVTHLLHQIGQGDADAWQRLLPVVYDELRDIARRRVGGFADATLGSTALVHEAYMRLVQPDARAYKDRHHFFAVATLAMRQILVDYARRKTAEKRGGGQPPEQLQEDGVARTDRIEEILFIDRALERVRAIDERAARVTELRYFGGLTIEETADVLGVDPRTVKRDWRKARAFLSVMFEESDAEASPDGDSDGR
ncbi:MAG: ECF-type sigma factor [Candidatus Eisenbacteria bacterium]|uniref:Sigma-70 family RNA polymerase sigma factor n=1 Tax=Eiseniibacteriota bacterium TaxID=2212470 RepID=A0A956LVY9_UNCEI|nr:sigma-70 family RNA polymerase sigma factor [Candidatus Eisenbacteria bacterium]